MIVVTFVKNTSSLTFESYLILKMLVLILLLILFPNYVISKEKVMVKYDKPLPHLRLKMEEVIDDQAHESIDESSDNFLTFLVDNVNELFVPSDNSTITTTHEDELDSASLLDIFKTLSDTIPIKMSSTNNSLISDNFYLPFLREKNNFEDSNLNSSNEIDMELLQSLKKLEIISQKTEKNSLYPLTRSCIACDNILDKHCSNPKSELVPSINCQREDDLCYSQHTPFGIIDRGCFNVNHDLQLFVCACNLCNYISIFEMPHMFANKRDWVENVIELSRAKRFRDSIFKDMACLKCEVNATAKKDNKVADADCLEGNIASLPSQICTGEEICGVKAIRSQGYAWRGCVTEPLYNYWWTLCDDDWCNYDPLVSIYDIVNY